MFGVLCVVLVGSCVEGHTCKMLVFLYCANGFFAYLRKNEKLFYFLSCDKMIYKINKTYQKVAKCGVWVCHEHTGERNTQMAS
jgi:hypothetical protein